MTEKKTKRYKPPVFRGPRGGINEPPDARKERILALFNESDIKNIKRLLEENPHIANREIKNSLNLKQSTIQINILVRQIIAKKI